MTTQHYGYNIMRIVDYRVFRLLDLTNLTKGVVRYISAGWQPLGGMYKDASRDTIFYYQTMVKYETQKLEE